MRHHGLASRALPLALWAWAAPLPCFLFAACQEAGASVVGAADANVGGCGAAASDSTSASAALTCTSASVPIVLSSGMLQVVGSSTDDLASDTGNESEEPQVSLETKVGHRVPAGSSASSAGGKGGVAADGAADARVGGGAGAGVGGGAGAGGDVGDGGPSADNTDLLRDFMKAADTGPEHVAAAGGKGAGKAAGGEGAGEAAGGGGAAEAAGGGGAGEAAGGKGAGEAAGGKGAGEGEGAGEGAAGEGTAGEGDGEGASSGEQQHGGGTEQHQTSHGGGGTAHKAGEHARLHYSLLLVFVVLAVGCATCSVLDRVLPALPYTCVVFVEGFLISVLEDTDLLPWGSTHKAVDMWQHVEPHFAFYALLAPLVFADAMTMNFSMLKTCFWQCMLLAGPGVILGAGIIGVACRILLPYGWDWHVAMLFGSILSATDPVAVVAIFGSLGVSPKLTMLVSGEALFNDGTAVVLFELMLMFVLGSVPTSARILRFFASKTILGPLMGLVVGNIAVYCITRVSKGHFHSDGMSQVMVTICCGYLAFILAELELTSSGVLAAVVAGITVAGSAWPRFIDKRTITIVWHTIEFAANTLIFVLAGVLFGHVCVREHLSIRDYLLLLVVYVVVMVSRVLMLGALAPIMRRIGPPISNQEFAVMGWSGLRGAVGLLMAVVVDGVESTHFRKETTSRIMFHVGGVAAMTLLINGTLTPRVLRACGLMSTKEEHERMLDEVKRQVALRAQQQLHEELSLTSGHVGPRKSPAAVSTATLFEGVQARQVAQLVPELQPQDEPRATHLTKGRGGASRELNENVMRLLREMALRAVRSIYYNLGSEGIVEKSSPTMTALVDAANEALVRADEPVCSWTSVVKALKIGAYSNPQEYRATLFFPAFFDSRGRFSRYTEQCISATLAFVFAHERACEELMFFFGKEAFAEVLEAQTVLRECRSQIDISRLAMESLPKETVASARTKMLAAKILNYQASVVSDLVHKGVILDDDGAHLEHLIRHSMKRLESAPLQGLTSSSTPRDGAGRIG